jgi:hypothetical protein
MVLQSILNNLLDAEASALESGDINAFKRAASALILAEAENNGDLAGFCVSGD